MKEYIEREAALKELEEKLLRGAPPANTYMESIIGIVRCVMKMLPAADVAPVVHAYRAYEDEKDIIPHCSSCGNEQDFFDNYCPYCGARMDGGATADGDAVRPSDDSIDLGPRNDTPMKTSTTLTVKLDGDAHV